MPSSVSALTLPMKYSASVACRRFSLRAAASLVFCVSARKYRSLRWAWSSFSQAVKPIWSRVVELPVETSVPSGTSSFKRARACAPVSTYSISTPRSRNASPSRSMTPRSIVWATRSSGLEWRNHTCDTLGRLSENTRVTPPGRGATREAVRVAAGRLRTPQGGGVWGQPQLRDGAWDELAACSAPCCARGSGCCDAKRDARVDSCPGAADDQLHHVRRAPPRNASGGPWLLRAARHSRRDQLNASVRAPDAGAARSPFRYSELGHRQLRVLDGRPRRGFRRLHGRRGAAQQPVLGLARHPVV